MQEFLKLTAVFFTGVIVTLVVINSPARPVAQTNVLGASDEFQQAIKDKVVQKEQEHLNFFSKFISEKLGPSITQNPILSPFFNTKKSVEGALTSVKNLPDDQRQAICKQICTQ